MTRDLHDSNLYTYGRMGENNVVLVCLHTDSTGTSLATEVIRRLKPAFSSLRRGLLVGTGEVVVCDMSGA